MQKMNGTGTFHCTKKQGSYQKSKILCERDAEARRGTTETKWWQPCASVGGRHRMSVCRRIPYKSSVIFSEHEAIETIKSSEGDRETSCP